MSDAQKCYARCTVPFQMHSLGRNSREESGPMLVRKRSVDVWPVCISSSGLGALSLCHEIGGDLDRVSSYLRGGGPVPQLRLPTILSPVNYGPESVLEAFFGEYVSPERTQEDIKDGPTVFSEDDEESESDNDMDDGDLILGRMDMFSVDDDDGRNVGKDDKKSSANRQNEKQAVAADPLDKEQASAETGRSAGKVGNNLTRLANLSPGGGGPQLLTSLANVKEWHRCAMENAVFCAGMYYVAMVMG